MSKKILFLLPKFEFGGTVFSTYNMVKMLNEMTDWDISVFPIIADGPVREIYENINVIDSDFLMDSYYANMSEYNGFKKIKVLGGKCLNRIFKMVSSDYERRMFSRVAEKLQSSYKFDYVASCQEGTSTEFVSCFSGCKKLAWFRSEMSVYLRKHISKEKAQELKDIYGRIDRIICVSKTTRDDFAKYFPSIDDRIVAIHNIQRIEEIIQKSLEHIEDPFDKDFFSIVSVGRMAPQKRFAEIPHIAKKLIESGKQFKWYIIGGGNIDGEFDNLKTNLEKEGVGDNVMLLGSRVNPYPYIRMADILCIPSSYEACPRVVAEAHVLGKPVISADYDSASEFISNGTDGYIGGIEELSSLIMKIMDDSEESRKIRENSRNFTLDTDKILKQLKEVFSI